jgi:hypothetical protein
MEIPPAPETERAEPYRFCDDTELHSLLLLFGGADGTATSRTLLAELRERGIEEGPHILHQMVQEGVMYECKRERGGPVYALALRGKKMMRTLWKEQEHTHKPPMETADATNAQPGTEEKIGVLQERLRNGLPLWHPDDPHHRRIDPRDDLA